ncbi:MAG: antitoxin [Solirubrobacterales bacterium]
MPRTTFDLDATVLADLRNRAATERKSMGQVASELLAIGLDGKSVDEPPPLRWARKDLGFKVDLEDKDAVWRILDAEEFGVADR